MTLGNLFYRVEGANTFPKHLPKPTIPKLPRPSVMLEENTIQQKRSNTKPSPKIHQRQLSHQNKKEKTL